MMHQMPIYLDFVRTLKDSQHTVVSTFASPHEPTLSPKAYKRAFASPAQVAQRALMFADPQKNKINLCFVDRLVQIEKDSNSADMYDFLHNPQNGNLNFTLSSPFLLAFWAEVNHAAKVLLLFYCCAADGAWASVCIFG